MLYTSQVGQVNKISEPPPAPAKEIEVETLVILEGHDNYVDVAAWSPVEDLIVTGSTDE